MTDSIEVSKAQNAATIGVSTGLARSLILQILFYWYRSPLKFFRPIRIDYLAMAKAVLPPIPEHGRNRYISRWRRSSLGLIAHAVRIKGLDFVPKFILPPLLVNSLIGSVLFTTYTSLLSSLDPTYLVKIPPENKKHSPAFLAGAISGVTSAFISTPFDSLQTRMEVRELLNGRHKDIISYTLDGIRQAGFRTLYKGLVWNVFKDSIGFSLFFGTFEYSKYQLERSLRKRTELNQSWTKATATLVSGSLAAIAYQTIDYPLQRFTNLIYAEASFLEFYSGQKRQDFYSRAIKDIKRIAMKRSWRFFYDGFSTTILKSLPASAVGLFLYELFKEKIGAVHSVPTTSSLSSIS